MQAQQTKTMTLVAVGLGVAMVALDTNVLAVGTPTIARDLGASLSGIQWLTNGYLLALGALLIVGGKLGDRLGRKRVFVAGLVAFALSSLLCAAATSTAMLVGLRVLQGVAGALLIPNTVALLRATFPPGELSRALGIWAGFSAVAIAIGPLVGGVLVADVGWQSIFLLNLPLGAVALAVAVRWVPESRDPGDAGSFDVPGVALLSGALVLIIWALTRSQDAGLGAEAVVVPAALGAGVLAAFVWRERRAAAPLVPLDLFRSRALSIATLIVVLAFFAMFGVLTFMGLYLQNVRGFSPLETGVRLLPLAAMYIVSPPLGGRLIERFGTRAALVGGMAVLAVGLLALARAGASTSYAVEWPGYVLVGLGMGVANVASIRAIVTSAPADRGGIASGVQATASQLGGVLGVSVLGSVIAVGVKGVLAGKLAQASVPPDVAGAALARTRDVAQGLPAVPPDLPAELAAGVQRACSAAFLEGLHRAMRIGALLAFGSAGLGLLLGRAEPVEAPARQRPRPATVPPRAARTASPANRSAG
jgi:EmrB/QacA subfamily drug resistance transporter